MEIIYVTRDGDAVTFCPKDLTSPQFEEAVARVLERDVAGGSLTVEADDAKTLIAYVDSTVVAFNFGDTYAR
uniref:hypothetical protein n=1 Tax=Pseudonocardia sp. CA-138482 TaxID=3240023 RepID=UPI003F498E54